MEPEQPNMQSDPAEVPPTSASSPKRRVIVVAVIVAALTVGAILMTVLMSNDDSVDQRDKTAQSQPSASEQQATEPAEDTESIAEADGCLTAVQNATVDCSGTDIVIESNGLPTHQMMVGIANGGWNGQWPEAQNYTGSNAFMIPKTLVLASNPALTVMNTAGVTANGIPFFFPHSPGRAGDSNCVYTSDSGECFRDPVADGEMDECGGHTGRGNDYHYHATPTYLIDELEDGAIVGYMLDGVPIYANTIEGSTEYEGCGGYVSPAGLIHYAFSDDFPYVTDCMLGEFSEGPRTQGSDVYTGTINAKDSGSITGFSEDADGCHTMTFSSGQSLKYCH